MLRKPDRPRRAQYLLPRDGTTHVIFEPSAFAHFLGTGTQAPRQPGAVPQGLCAEQQAPCAGFGCP